MGSSRYYRGRIVEALRQSPEGISVTKVEDLFSEVLTKKLDSIITSLVRDGLAVRIGTTLRLP
jgi:hypothetical protein